jgi:hypothetical protein
MAPVRANFLRYITLNHKHRRGFRPTLDALDPRQLMAAHLTASLARGVLTVAGTEAADVIAISVEGPSRGNRGGSVVVAGVHRAFRANQVKRIEVQGGGGNDAVSVETHGRAPIPWRISGGPGGDIVNGLIQAPVPTAPVSALATEQRIIALTNVERQNAGLAPLTVNAALMQAASIQSDNMARLDTMSHDLPGTAQPTMTDRAAAVGYKYAWLGENIAYGYADADAVVAGWMGSAEHRANILRANYTEIGVSVAYTAQGRPYYTQEFGQPA